jgi:hypothetical protein
MKALPVPGHQIKPYEVFGQIIDSFFLTFKRRVKK